MMWGIIKLVAFLIMIILLWSTGMLAAAYDLLYDALLGASKIIWDGMSGTIP